MVTWLHKVMEWYTFYRYIPVISWPVVCVPLSILSIFSSSFMFCSFDSSIFPFLSVLTKNAIDKIYNNGKMWLTENMELQSFLIDSIRGAGHYLPAV